MTEAATFAAAFIAFFTGHHLGDHVLQTDRQAVGKTGSGWPAVRAMAGHLLTYHLCIAVLLLGLTAVGIPLSPVGVAVGLAWSAGSHGFIDRRWPVQWLLTRLGSPRFASLAGKGMNGLYLADQSLHLGNLFVAALLVTTIR